MKTYNFWAMPLMALGLMALIASGDAGCSRSGIKGHVYLIMGDQMPSPGKPPSTPRGMKTELYIYALTNMSQVTRVGNTAFYSQINTPLIAIVKTDEQGAFAVKLPVGRYSLFVKKNDKYYANLFDGDNNIYPVEVANGLMTEVEFKADYGAVY